MEENYEMDLLTEEERQFFQDQDLEEFADPDGYITAGVDEREERINVRREKIESDYKDLLWKQGAEIELLKDENEKLRKNLLGQGEQKNEKSSAAAVIQLRAETSRLMKNLSESEIETRRHIELLSKQREIIESLKASHGNVKKDRSISETALKKQKETIDRLMRNANKGNHILNRQKEALGTQEKNHKCIREGK